MSCRQEWNALAGALFGRQCRSVSFPIKTPEYLFSARVLQSCIGAKLRGWVV